MRDYSKSIVIVMALSISSIFGGGGGGGGAVAKSLKKKNKSFLERQQMKVKSELGGEKSSPKTPKLEIGSPIIVIEAPPVLKTAASIPCLRPNSGLLNPGDVGRYITHISLLNFFYFYLFFIFLNNRDDGWMDGCSL